MEKKTKKRKSPSAGTNKQLSSLLDAIQSNAIHATQGKDWQSKHVTEKKLLHFFGTKIIEQRNRLPTRSCFDYIDEHIEGKAVSVEEIQAFKDQLQTKHGLCRISKHELQTKIPTSLKPVTKSDARNGKKIGIVQVQAYVLDVILDSSNNINHFKKQLAELPANVLGCHLCKNKCCAQGHVVLADHKYNLKNEFCPAYWIIEKQLFSFCTCSSRRPCFAPGPRFDREVFRHRIQNLIVLLQGEK
jgi:hypothetical protein